MKPPTTYFEWKQMLESFSQEDDNVLSLLNDGTMTLDAGTVERFAKLIDETFKKRKKVWLDKLKNASQSQIIRSPSDFSVVISNAKNSLKSIIAFSDLKPF